MKKILIVILAVLVVSCSNLSTKKTSILKNSFNANSTMFFSLADMAYQNHDYKDALLLLEKAEKNDPKSLQIKEMIILSLDALSKKDKEQREKLLTLSEKYIKEGFKTDKIYLPRINALISNHKLKEAKKELEASIKISPTAEKYYKLFLLDGFINKIPNNKLLEKSIKLSDDENYDFYILKNLKTMKNPIVLEASRIIYEKWDDKKAFDFYAKNLLKYRLYKTFQELTTQRLADKKKISLDTARSILEMLEQEKDYKTINKYYEEFIDFNDESIDRLLFSVQESLKNYDRAVFLLKRILSNYSDDEDRQTIYFFLAKTYLSNLQIKEAINTIIKISDFSKIDYLLTDKEVMNNYSEKEIMKAKKIYLNSDMIDDNYKLFFQYCLENEDKEKALKFLEKIKFTEISKKNAIYVDDIFLENNEVEKAREIFKKIPSVKESFNFFTAYYYLANKDYKNAEKYSQKELQENNNVAGYLFYASILEKENKIEEAVKLLEKANRKFPHNPEILNGLGYMMVENNIKLDVAEKLLTEATKLDSSSENIWDSLMWLYYKQGKYIKALETFPTAKLDEIKSSTIAYHLGEIYYKLGRMSDAKYYFKLAIELNTEDDAVDNSINKLKTFFKENENE